MTLEWILGRCDSLRAEVFLRVTVPVGVEPEDAALTGTLTGPECRGAITLPVTAKFMEVPTGRAIASMQTVVARAILTEPSSWTPDLPSLYRLDARLVAGGRAVARWNRMVGLRPLGVRGRSLWLDGRRYVPRGLVMPAVAVAVGAFREASVAAVVADPPDDLLERCGAEGVAVLGVLRDSAGGPLDAESACQRVPHWSWHPAVMMAIVPADMPREAAAAIAAATRGSRGTMLIAQEVHGSQPPPEPIAGMDALVMSLAAESVPHPAWLLPRPSLPMVACRAREAVLGAPSRTPCDAFQADLAAWRMSAGSEAVSWDWAGFVCGVA